MCLIAFNWQPETETPLTLVANRDEYFRRKTALMARWSDQSEIIAGRDLEAKGTWLGVNAWNGRFAALTNIRRPFYHQHFEKSRGRLVADFLQSDLTATQYLDAVHLEKSSYSGFNLLVFDGFDLCYLNSEQQPRAVEPGLHGLSNADLDSCGWPKVDSARNKLQHWLEKEGSIYDLAILLNSKTLAPPEALPNTGVDPAEEHQLSAEFIAMDGYGTRCSTGLIWRRGQIKLSEINYNGDGQIIGKVAFKITLKNF